MGATQGKTGSAGAGGWSVQYLQEMADYINSRTAYGSEKPLSPEQLTALKSQMSFLPANQRDVVTILFRQLNTQGICNGISGEQLTWCHLRAYTLGIVDAARLTQRYEQMSVPEYQRQLPSFAALGFRTADAAALGAIIGYWVLKNAPWDLQSHPQDLKNQRNSFEGHYRRVSTDDLIEIRKRLKTVGKLGDGADADAIIDKIPLLEPTQKLALVNHLKRLQPDGEKLTWTDIMAYVEELCDKASKRFTSIRDGQEFYTLDSEAYERNFTDFNAAGIDGMTAVVLGIVLGTWAVDGLPATSN